MIEALVVVGTLAGLAVLAAAVSWLFLVRRLRQLADQIGHAVQAEARQAFLSWKAAADAVQRSAGKLDQGLESLARTLDRADRVTERLEPESLTHTVVAPLLVKIGAWLGGFRKGLGSAHRRKTDEGLED